MKQKIIRTALGLVVVLVVASAFYVYRGAINKPRESAGDAALGAILQKAHDAKLKDGSCKLRGDAFDSRARTLEREAHAKLTIGTRKDSVIHFFAENGIPVTFTRDEASGTIYTSGCSPVGCGTDNALLGVRVGLDEKGSVISEPVIGSMYTDCL
ncbi:MAG: hypothetical protein ABSD72_18315 [Terracidiphilus sp.]|jgi:hypothetical protein